MCLAIEAADEAVTIEQRQTKITILALLMRDVALDLVVEIEYLSTANTLNDGIIEWR